MYGRRNDRRADSMMREALGLLVALVVLGGAAALVVRAVLVDLAASLPL